MPLIANSPDGEPVMAPEAERFTDYSCPQCNAPVSFVRSHLRDPKNAEKHRVAAHFRYNNCTHGTIDEVSSTSYSGGSANGGGESSIHMNRKRTALAAALERFDASEWGIEKKLGSKRADAWLKLENPHEWYGKGFAIEYQHKNEGKDIKETENIYAQQEYTTLWLWEDQFDFSSALPDVDLFDGRVNPPWPEVVPEKSQWADVPLRDWVSEWEAAHENELTQSKVPAKILRHWCVPTQREYWRNQPWKDRFRQRIHSDYKILHGLVSESKISSKSVPATIYRGWITRTIWRKSDWEARFRDQSVTGSTHIPSVDSKPEIEISVDPCGVIPEWLLRKWWHRGKQALERDASERPEKPGTVFEDVQCHVCGVYCYAPNAGRRCPDCGAKYDWEWNLRTGRVDEETASEYL